MAALKEKEGGRHEVYVLITILVKAVSSNMH